MQETYLRLRSKQKRYEEMSNSKANRGTEVFRFYDELRKKYAKARKDNKNDKQ